MLNYEDNEMVAKKKTNFDIKLVITNITLYISDSEI